MDGKIKVEARINAPVEKVWSFYNDPGHVVKWNNASEDWHTPHAENDFREGGRFNYRMESREGSEGFDFTGTYNEIIENEFVRYTMDDGRIVEVKFEEVDGATLVSVEFDAEEENSLEMQKDGWQAILNNFKKYVEEQ